MGPFAACSFHGSIRAETLRHAQPPHPESGLSQCPSYSQICLVHKQRPRVGQNLQIPVRSKNGTAVPYKCPRFLKATIRWFNSSLSPCLADLCAVDGNDFFEISTVYLRYFHKGKAHASKKAIVITLFQIGPYQSALHHNGLMLGKLDDQLIMVVFQEPLLAVDEHALRCDIPRFSFDHAFIRDHRNRPSHTDSGVFAPFGTVRPPRFSFTPWIPPMNSSSAPLKPGFRFAATSFREFATTGAHDSECRLQANILLYTTISSI